jgi:hypothetical protein
LEFLDQFFSDGPTSDAADTATTPPAAFTHKKTEEEDSDEEDTDAVDDAAVLKETLFWSQWGR